MPRPIREAAVSPAVVDRSEGRSRAARGCVGTCLLLLLSPCGCAPGEPGGFGLRAGAFIPGGGRTTDYEADYLLGASYGRGTSESGSWSWEAGLDYTSPEAEDGSEEMHLLLVRGDLGTSLHSWAGSGTSLYLHWGGQFAFRVSPGSGTDFMLTGGLGLRSGSTRWDFRFAGQSALGESNVDQFWVLTAGCRF